MLIIILSLLLSSHSIMFTFYLFQAASDQSADLRSTSLDADMEEDISVLPDVTMPPDFQESFLSDSPPLEAYAQSEPVTYFLGKSRRGADQLISSDGYSYNIHRRNKNGTIKWQCVIRNKNIACHAKVTQSNGTFLRNDEPHVHRAVPSAVEKNRMIIEGFKAALENPYRSGAAIAKTLQQNNCVPELPNTTSMARRLNRHREKTRPKHPHSLEDFNIDLDHVPHIFDTWQVQVGDRKHIIFSTLEQQDLLVKSKTWYLDGTFKIVKEPFVQLYCIHAFIRSGKVAKQVPLIFILMSGRKTCDYRRLFYVIKEMVGECDVKEMVLDFEKPVWKAIRSEFPQVRLRGCTFHWTRAVWQKVQKSNLQVPYNKDFPTNKFVKKLLALPMLPKEHIAPVFEILSTGAVTQPLQDLIEYIRKNWITS